MDHIEWIKEWKKQNRAKKSQKTVKVSETPKQQFRPMTNGDISRINFDVAIGELIYEAILNGGQKEWDDEYGGCEWSDIVSLFKSRLEGDSWLRGMFTGDWRVIRGILQEMMNNGTIFRHTVDIGVERYCLSERDNACVWMSYDDNHTPLMNVPGTLRTACSEASAYSAATMRLAYIERVAQ